MAYHEGVQTRGPFVPDKPKAIVIYDTWSGNTKLIAEVLSDVLACPAVLVDDADMQATEGSDLVVIGSPVHGGRPTDKIETLLSEMRTPHASAVFVTFGAPAFGPFMAECCLDFMEKNLHGTSLGRFRCHGFHQIMRTYPSRPDARDKADAARFATGILERWLKDGHAGSVFGRQGLKASVTRSKLGLESI